MELTSHDLLDIRLKSADFNRKLTEMVKTEFVEGRLGEEIYVVFEVGCTNFLLYQLSKYHLQKVSHDCINIRCRFRKLFRDKKLRAQGFLLNNIRRWHYYSISSSNKKNMLLIDLNYAFVSFDKRISGFFLNFLEYFSKHHSCLYVGNITKPNANKLFSTVSWKELYTRDVKYQYRKELRSMEKVWFNKETQEKILKIITRIIDQYNFPYNESELLKLLNLWFSKVVPVIVKSLNISYALVHRYSLKKIVTTDVNDLKIRALCYVAKKMEVSTYMLQQYMNGVEAVEYLSLLQNKILCFGRYDHKLFMKFGIRSDQIDICGALKTWDDVNINIVNRKIFMTSLNVTQEKYVVLISGPENSTEYGEVDSLLSPQEYNTILDEFINAAKKFPDVGFIIKWHPEEYRKKKTASFKKIRNVYEVKDTDIRSLLVHSELIVTFVSSIGMDAIHMKKPMLIADYSCLEDKVFDYKYAPNVEVLNKKGDMEFAIGKILQADEYVIKDSDIINYMSFHYDGYGESRPILDVYKNYENSLI